MPCLEVTAIPSVEQAEILITIIQSCQAPVSCVLSGEQPLGTILNRWYFLHILATNILTTGYLRSFSFATEKQTMLLLPTSAMIKHLIHSQHP